MNIRITLINVLTLILVCVSLYSLKQNNTLDYLANKKDAILSSLKNSTTNEQKNNIATQNTTSTKSISVEKKVISTIPAPVEKKVSVQPVTPGPLQVNKGSNFSSYSGLITVEGVIERTNYERQINSLSGLVESSDLDASAQVKANDILNRQYFEHTSPDGKTVSDLVSAAGYTYVRVGENLALGDFSSEIDLLKAWMNSPGHRANILDTRYQDMGVGIAFGNYQGRNVLVAVQHFGRPRSSCPSVDDQLKIKVSDLQSQATIISTGLDTLRSRIDEMRANGDYVDNSIIEAYNNSVNQYDSIINQAKVLRDTYNAEVNSFNACISAL